MGYFTDTYTTNIEPILKDWLTDQIRGQNVTDLSLSLTNRAIRNIWAKKPWNDFATDVTVSLVSNSYTFPANFGRIISIWGDLSGDGVPQYWYYEADLYEKGYKLRDSFTKALGHSWAITFHYPQSAQIQMIYQRVPEDLVGTGTEYLCFPSNLILLEAQKIDTRENGNLKEYQGYAVAFDEEFKDFCNAHQWVNFDPTPHLNDRQGNNVTVESYTLNGAGFGVVSSYSNARLS